MPIFRVDGATEVPSRSRTCRECNLPFLFRLVHLVGELLRSLVGLHRSVIVLIYHTSHGSHMLFLVFDCYFG